jgi:hypothetical protein
MLAMVEMMRINGFSGVFSEKPKPRVHNWDNPSDVMRYSSWAIH